MGNIPTSPEEYHKETVKCYEEEIKEIYIFLAEMKMGFEKDVARVDEDVKAGVISVNLAEDLKRMKKEKYDALQIRWINEIESLKLEIKK